MKRIHDLGLVLLTANIDQIGVGVPLHEEDVKKIYNWFQDKEIEMADELADGVQVDRSKLERMSIGADDFRIYAGENIIDREDLNKRLGKIIEKDTDPSIE